MRRRDSFFFSRRLGLDPSRPSCIPPLIPFGFSGWDPLVNSLERGGGDDEGAGSLLEIGFLSPLSPGLSSARPCPRPYVTRSTAKLLIISIYIGYGHG